MLEDFYSICGRLCIYTAAHGVFSKLVCKPLFGDGCRNGFEFPDYDCVRSTVLFWIIYPSILIYSMYQTESFDIWWNGDWDNFDSIWLYRLYYIISSKFVWDFIGEKLDNLLILHHIACIIIVYLQVYVNKFSVGCVITGFVVGEIGSGSFNIYVMSPTYRSIIIHKTMITISDILGLYTCISSCLAEPHQTIQITTGVILCLLVLGREYSVHSITFGIKSKESLVHEE